MSSVDAAIGPQPSSRDTISRYNRWQVGHTLGAVGIHAVLLSYTVLAMFPILLTLVNSFKKQGDIFGHPYTLPFGTMFSLLGYQTVFKRAEALQYLQNSLVVTLGS